MTEIDWDRLSEVVSEHVDGGEVPGAVLAVDHGGEVRIESVGTSEVGGTVPLSGDTIFRVSSMTKPLVAALTLMLVEDGTLALDAPVERWAPELAERQVLRHPGGSLEDTVPAERSISVADLLTMRMGFGFFFEPSPVLDRATAAGLGIGPPDPSVPLTPDEWMARLAELPLMHQPGADWMYELSYGVLGVVVARAGGKPLDALLHERLLVPLGMTDTGFMVPAEARNRLIPCVTPVESGLAVFDDVENSRWNCRPAFPDGRGGLVSTASDYLAFARMLLDGGLHDGERLLAEQSVAAMTTDQLGPQRAASAAAGVFLSNDASWGYGVEVSAARYGWGGGLGTTWYSYPAHDTAAVLLTQCLPPPEPLVDAFWATLGAML